MRALLRLIPYYRRHRVPFWLGIGLLLVARIFEALIPQLLKLGIDEIASGSAALAAIAGGIVACSAARFVAIWFGRRAVRILGVEVAYDLRNRLYQHLQLQGPGFFGRYRTGDLMARAINDIGLIRRVIAAGTRTVFVLVFSAAVAFAFMLAESPSLTLLLIPPMPFVFGTAYLMSRRLHNQSLLVQEGFSELSDRVQENLTGIRTIQALNQEEMETRRFDDCNERYREWNLDLLRTNSVLASLMPSLGNISVLIVLFFGGMQVLDGRITLGTFTAFVWYLNMVLWPVRQAGSMINLFQRGAAGTARLFELLDSVPEIEDRPLPSTPAQIRGGIEFRDLSYSYPGAPAPALQDISLRIEPGETVAILGRVGSGKSTLLRLLVRQLEAPADTLFVDGCQAPDFPLARLRQQIALVPQEPFLFSETVRDNVSYDDPERTDAAVELATETAELSETIAGFPNGISTQVGERGVLLSGGQKQRITLARALVRDAPILLLDDPFASVDSETEESILNRLSELRAEQSTLLVSHRVSAVRAADRVVVLDEGRVVEMGSPAELRAREGAYAALERVQLRRDELLSDLGAGGEAA